jgi:ABC-type tungstate transport system permease subunit
VAAPALEGLLAASTAVSMALATYSTYSHEAIMLSAASTDDLDLSGLLQFTRYHNQPIGSALSVCTA